MKTAQKFTAKIESATLADAQAWNQSSEQAMFCVEFLEAYSINQINGWEDQLERKFESLLVND